MSHSVETMASNAIGSRNIVRSTQADSTLNSNSKSNSMKTTESWWSSLFLFSALPHWPSITLILHALLFEALPAPVNDKNESGSCSSSSSISPRASKAASNLTPASLGVCLRVRAAMLLRLLFNVLLTPFWTLCWIIDELLYGRLVDGQPIKSAIYCAGAPRSGTTFLFSVLNENTEQFMSVTHRQWRYPYVFMHLHVFPLLRRLCEACGWSWDHYWQGSGAGAIASTLHPDEMDEAEEDDIVYEEVCNWHPFVALWYPFDSVYRAMCRFEAPQHTEEKQADGTPSYGHGLPLSVQRRMLRVRNRVVRKAAFLWACNRRAQGKEDLAPIFVCKCSKSNSKLTALLSQPEWESAVLLTIWRQPQKSLASLARLVYMSSLAKTGWQSDPLQPKSVVGNYLLDQVTEGNCLVSAMSSLPSNRVINVEYDLFSRFTKSTVQAVFRRVGIQMTPSYTKYLEQLQSSQNARPTKYSNEKQKDEDDKQSQNQAEKSKEAMTTAAPVLPSPSDNANDKEIEAAMSRVPSPIASTAVSVCVTRCSSPVHHSPLSDASSLPASSPYSSSFMSIPNHFLFSPSPQESPTLLSPADPSGGNIRLRNVVASSSSSAFTPADMAAAAQVALTKLSSNGMSNSTSDSMPATATTSASAGHAAAILATPASSSVTDFFDEAYAQRIVSQYFNETEWTTYNATRAKVKLMHRTMLNEYMLLTATQPVAK